MEHTSRRAFRILVGVPYEEAEAPKEFDSGVFKRAGVILISGIIFFIFVSVCLGDTASWYGTTDDHTDPWKHTTTANGERFNENALTAASWRFPLGSRVRVTNLANGRSIVVRINDRGPGRHLARKGRVLDLSRGSFARIANLNEGVINVKIVRIS